MRQCTQMNTVDANAASVGHMRCPVAAESSEDFCSPLLRKARCSGNKLDTEQRRGLLRQDIDVLNGVQARFLGEKYEKSKSFLFFHGNYAERGTPVRIRAPSS